MSNATDTYLAVGVAEHPDTHCWQVWIWMEDMPLTSVYATTDQDEAVEVGIDLLSQLGHEATRQAAIRHWLGASPQPVMPLPRLLAVQIAATCRKGKEREVGA